MPPFLSRLGAFWKRWWKHVAGGAALVAVIIWVAYWRAALYAWFSHFEFLKQLLILVAISVLLVLGWLFRRGFRKTFSTTSSWASYMLGHGLLMFAFLSVGIILALTGSSVAPYTSRVINGPASSYAEDPSRGPVIKQLDAKNCRHVMILAQTETPAGSDATIIVYGATPGGAWPKEKHEIARIDTTPGSWSRWEHQNSDTVITIFITAGSSLNPATKVDVLVFLSPE
jgi:hypothetical protein